MIVFSATMLTARCLGSLLSANQCSLGKSLDEKGLRSPSRRAGRCIMR